MLYAVLFEDDPSRADQRNRHMAEHLSFLERNGARIQSAGPLFEAGPEAGTGAGGLWIVDAEDAAAVRRLVEADPFWPTGLRRAVRILEWRRVFAGGSRQIG